MLRTHTCGQLNVNDIGKEVTLCGWVASRRDHGKLVFIDIRDRFGITQIVFIPKESADAYKKAQDLRGEFVIKVKGKVNRRPEGTINPKLTTGEIEVVATDLDILNPSLTPPFEIEEDTDVTEEMRLKYRYLDLRRQKVLENFILRHRLYKIIRSFLEAQGFIECETPILTKSTPEGARDYLVPSRLNPKKFFALPQSPQLFKQILMVGAIEKYYQIAKCFRDEDLRADRQPEFTQLDLEMSFIDEEDVFSLSENLMRSVFKEIKNIDLNIPFHRITFEEAQKKYNSDKPDLRKETNCEFAFCWVVDFPLFKYNEEEKRWESEHHPFTAPKVIDLSLLEVSPEKVKARSYDLVLNGMEVASGSIRIHRQELQSKIFKIIGINSVEARRRFGFLLEAFEFGAPPHGGIAFGLDRLLAILAGEESIREVITFPKTQKAYCPLTGAPSEVDDKQLKELNISIIPSRSPSDKTRGRLPKGPKKKKRRLKMQIKRLLLVIGLLSFGVISLTGCTVRTYSLIQDRVDQDLTGNRGYIQGTAPAIEPGERKTQRTTQVVEIEFGPKAKLGKAKQKPVEQKPISVPEVPMVEPTAIETEPISKVAQKVQEYKVQKGDTLQKISLGFYGTTKKWTKIYDANKDKLKGPDKIYPGQTINIPLEELKEPKENLK